MLGIDPRVGRAAWTVLLLGLLVAAAYKIRETLAVFMIAVLFAYMLMPLVEMVERFTPKQVSTTLALAIVYLVLVGIIIGLSVTVGSRLVEEINTLAGRLPELVTSGSLIDRIPLPAWLEPVRASIVQFIRTQFQGEGRGALAYAGAFGGRVLSGTKYILYIVLIPILAFFFLKDGREMRESIVDGLVERSRRPVLDSILEDINRLLGQYIRALALLSLTSFIAHSAFLAITGARYAVLFGVIAALGEFIPVIGPATAGITILLVSTLSGYSHGAIFVIFWIVYRMVQDYVLAPHLMSKGVNLNPLLVLFGVLAGEQIAGVAGMFFSVPMLATLRVIFVRLKRTRTIETVGPRAGI